MYIFNMYFNENSSVDAVEHIASFCQKTLQTAHPALLFPLSSLASIWSETTVDQCIERKDRQTVNRLKISFSQICSAALKELVLIRGCHCAELIHRSVMAKGESSLISRQSNQLCVCRLAEHF